MRSVLAFLFEARELIALLVVVGAAVVLVLFLLSFGPFVVQGFELPRPLATASAIEAGVALGTLSLAYGAMIQAESAERGRRYATFPRMRLLVGAALPGTTSHTNLAVGNMYRQGGSPHIGVENFGQGPAYDLRIGASWKVYDFEGAKTAEPQTLAKVPWAPVPTYIPSKHALGPREIEWIECVQWNSTIAKDSKLVSRIICLNVRVTWRNPDGGEEGPLQGGLQFIPGSSRPDPAGYGPDVWDWVAVDPSDAPSDASEYRCPPA